MDGQPRTFILMGRSGCGKGTQAELLRRHLSELDPGARFLHWETGDRFRSFISQDNFTAKLSKETMGRGGLMPSFLAIWNWTDLLVDELRGDECLIIDGSPRTLLEAQALETAFDFYGRSVVVIFYLQVSNAWATARLEARGRDDDRESSDIERRLAWFDKDVVPAIDFFKRHPERYRVAEINGEQTIEAVHQEILKVLG